MPTKKTIKRSIYDPAIASGDSAESYSPDCRDLGFLAGAVDTNDMGYRGGSSLFGSIAESPDSWRTRYERSDRLRRHTTEQGMSTWSFRPKE